MFPPILICALSASILPQQPGGGSFLPEWEISHGWSAGNLTELPDINGDGIAEWLHSTSSASPTFSQQGVVQAWSGMDGSLLWEFYGSEEYERVGRTEPLVIDLDADGTDELLLYDFVVYEAGHIYVLDAQSGAVEWRQDCPSGQDDFGKRVWIADADGDGQAEIFTSSLGERGTSNADQLHCFAADGSLRWRRDILAEGLEVYLEDLNGDNIPAVILAESTKTIHSSSNAGKIFNLDPSTGTTLWEIPGSHIYQRLGKDLRFEDCDLDGTVDLVALCPQTKVGTMTGAGGVFTFSGADGSLLWEIFGTVGNGGLGKNALLEDVDGNAGSELILPVPKSSSWDGQIFAHRISDGSLLWEASGLAGAEQGFGKTVLLDDFNSDGVKELLVGSARLNSTAPEVEYFAWGMYRATDGQAHWEKQWHDGFGRDPEVTPDDLDGDGISEFLIWNYHWYAPIGNGKERVGLAFAFDIDGNQLWRVDGGVAHRSFAYNVQAGDFNGDGTKEVSIHSLSNELFPGLGHGTLEARTGIAGDLLWKREGSRAYTGFGQNQRVVDLDGDGSSELICYSPNDDTWIGTDTGSLWSLNGYTGQTLFHKSGKREHEDFPSRWHLGQDTDGDGWLNLVILSRHEIANLSGSGNFTGFLEKSADTISASSGGEVDLFLNFTDAAKWYEYLIVLSAHGVGLNYELGFPVPLRKDHWFFVSADNQLPPGNFQAFHGVLNENGEATATISFAPNQIPSNLVGNTATFAALARLPWKGWKYCSIPQSVTVTL